jgi:tetratricopeptide (TPR) repeat protein
VPAASGPPASGPAGYAAAASGAAAFPPAEAPSFTRRDHVVACAGLGVLLLLAYGNSFSAGLVLDNRPIIAESPRVQTWALDTLKLIFTRDYWWPDAASDLYRPLTTLSYWANYTLLGNARDVTGYHVVNFALHWLNVCLVLALVGRLSASRAVGVVAAALFAVHPVSVESVTNIVGRADLLATLAVLAGGYCWIRAADAAGRARSAWLVGTAACAFAGVFTKESAIAIVAFCVLYDLMWRGGRAARGALARYAAFVPTVVAVVTVRLVMNATSDLTAQVFVDNPIAGAGPFAGFMTAWGVVGRYLALLVFPRTLSSDRSYNQIPVYGTADGAWATAQPWVALVVCAGLVWLAWRWRARHRVASWGVAFFLLALLPVSNLVLRIGSIMGDRFLYGPSIGFAAAAAYAIMTLSARTRARTAVTWVVTGIVVGAAAVRTRVRNTDWQDDLTLARSAIAAAPNSFRNHRAYAGALMARAQDEGTVDAAIASVERALAILDSPPLAADRRETHTLVDLGVYRRVKAQRMRERGDAVGAAEYLARSAEAFERAKEIDQAQSVAHRTRLLARGRDPDRNREVGNYALYLEAGDTYLEQRNWRAAHESARTAQRLMPDAARAYMISGLAAFYGGHPDEASLDIASALLLDARRTDILENIDVAYRAMRRPSPVVNDPAGMRLDTSNPETTRLLSAALARVEQNLRAAGRAADAERDRRRAAARYPGL